MAKEEVKMIQRIIRGRLVTDDLDAGHDVPDFCPLADMKASVQQILAVSKVHEEVLELERNVQKRVAEFGSVSPMEIDKWEEYDALHSDIVEELADVFDALFLFMNVFCIPMSQVAISACKKAKAKGELRRDSAMVIEREYDPERDGEEAYEDQYEWI